MKTLILTTLLGTIGLVPLAYGEEEMDAMPVGARPKGCAGQILVRPDRPLGPIRTLNAVNGAPFTRGGRGDVHFEAWKAAEIPYARLHDINLHYQYGAPFIVDVPWIFRNFEADENDPKSYDFAGTDALRRTAGEWPKSVRCHITDDVRIHTGWTLDREADGAIVLTLRPCSFAFLETE